MKDLIYLFESFAINYETIIRDLAPFVFLILITICFALFFVTKLIAHDLYESRKALSIAEKKIENNCAELFAANYTNDCLDSENQVLRQRIDSVE